MHDTETPRPPGVAWTQDVTPFVPSTTSDGPPLLDSRPRPDRLVDFDELYPLVADPHITDVLVIGGRGVWVDDGIRLRSVVGMVLPEARTRELAVRLVALGGRHVDESTPCADVHHVGGIRVHVVLRPIAHHGTAISIRLPSTEQLGLSDLEAAGFFTSVARTEVEDAVRARRNVLVSGATGSGKTTLLGAMLALVPHHERILTVEDVAELRVAHPHVVALQARQANAEGAGAIGLDRLIREALRMRPDRIVVGECRGAEVRELMSALNTGHDGGAGTLHANGVADVPARLEALGALAGLGSDALARQAVSAFERVFHVGRTAGTRRLEAVASLALDGSGRLVVRQTAPTAAAAAQ
ncbi:CpaF family protein [Curtobacterium sp. MCBD17_019]|uniref:CpaF family protein n=1 Tax=Curtobacterium sp. MCBD17_019 TaxID=2175669 RepID=UPI000DA8361B|nr:ATPase, T2SS/T4P/T4SS family [Curtobacterium sp. MCBD17_019]PZE74227.1 pilus assembly protein CpaF [Curtobacterium sp. MCBD17_019]